MIIFITIWNSIAFSMGIALLFDIIVQKTLNIKIGYMKILSVFLLSCIVVLIDVKFILISSCLFSLILINNYSNNLLFSIIVSLMSHLLLCIVHVIPSIAVALFVDDVEAIKKLWWYNVVYGCAFLLFSFIIYQILKKSSLSFIKFENFKYRISKPYYIFIINVTVLLACMSLLPFFYNLKIQMWKIQTIVYIFLSIIFLINFIGSFLIYRNIINLKIKETENEVEIKLAKKYKESIAELYDDIMNFKHDYLKIYSTMQIFIANNNMEGLSDFFNKNIVPISEELSNSSLDIKSLVLIENIALQSVLYSALITSKTKKIPLTIDVKDKISQTINMDTVDLSRVVGIFIQNAFEACEHIPNSNIEIGVLNINDGTLIVIKNTCIPNKIKMNKIFNLGESSKNGTHQGRGLHIAKNILKFYTNVTLNIHISKDNFICELFIK